MKKQLKSIFTNQFGKPIYILGYMAAVNITFKLNGKNKS